MKTIFDWTYKLLLFLSDNTGFTYKEINIIIWFIVIPLSWAFPIDKIRGRHVVKLTFAIILIITAILIKDFSAFSEQLFNASADGLRRLETLGLNYTSASVIVCLMVPLIIYGILIRKVYFKKSKI